MFWKDKSLEQLNHSEWESLCDGCAKCCLHKLQDTETEEVAFTWVHCSLLDCSTCKCSDYPNRLELVPNCLKITYQELEKISSALPSTCAYRLLYEGKELPSWHPLISNDLQSIHTANISIKDMAINELEVDSDELDLFIIEDEDF
ncbi:MAG: hypothetical protein BM556_05025 [Bacteriovorax sp. MedPE-SWde]|nr:MAG: hypothetical protein BM556_05025 [Bacteriovorax sp. MedPE-SWde]